MTVDINWVLVGITCAFIVLDFLTGISKAIMQKNVSSTVMREGLFHKLAFVLAIVLGIMCEVAMTQVDLGFTIPLTATVCGYIILTEVASILENMVALNPELKDSKILSIFKNSNAE